MNEQYLRVLLCRPDENGFLARRDLPDGRYLTLQPQLFGQTLLTISRAGDEYGYYDSYEYADPDIAYEAMKWWSGDGDPPLGWHRNPPSGRRRPDGDPTREYVRP